MNKECLSSENKMLINFTRELINQYNKSLGSELNNFRYKVNYNDSYERLVYSVNGKEMFRYTKKIMNTLEKDVANVVNNSDETCVIDYLVGILRKINIQSTVINDFVDYMFRTKNEIKGTYRDYYDLNIADNSNLYLTRDCLEIDYIQLSKPLLDYLDSREDKVDSFYSMINDLKVIGNGLSKQEVIERNEYKVLNFKR